MLDILAAAPKYVNGNFAGGYGLLFIGLGLILLSFAFKKK